MSILTYVDRMKISVVPDMVMNRIQMLIRDCNVRGLRPFFWSLQMVRLYEVDRELLVTLKFRAKVLIAVRKSKGWNGD